jgi:hypothetical protein
LAPKAQVGSAASELFEALGAHATLSVKSPIKGDFRLFPIGTLNG